MLLEARLACTPVSDLKRGTRVSRLSQQTWVLCQGPANCLLLHSASAQSSGVLQLAPAGAPVSASPEDSPYASENQNKSPSMYSNQPLGCGTLSAPQGPRFLSMPPSSPEDPERWNGKRSSRIIPLQLVSIIQDPRFHGCGV